MACQFMALREGGARTARSSSEIKTKEKYIRIWGNDNISQTNTNTRTKASKI